MQCPNHHSNLRMEQMQIRNIVGFSPTRVQSARFFLPTPACPAPSSYVAGWHSTTRTCAVLVIVATAICGCSTTSIICWNCVTYYTVVRLMPENNILMTWSLMLNLSSRTIAKNKYYSFTTHIQNARFSLCRHVRHRLLTSQVGIL